MSGFEIRQMELFTRWFERLRDREARARLLVRIRRPSLGTFGDVCNAGDGVSKLRVDCGPGYRLYFTRRGGQVIVLLAGGDKRAQQRDIRTAQGMARGLGEDGWLE